jgi:diguanylate cyclase (GGDEF)-like protein/PAS domain S-box-containing protein
MKHSYARVARTCGRPLALACVVLGLVTLLGYALDVELLFRPIKGDPATNPLTALVMVAAGVALLVNDLRHPAGSLPFIAVALAATGTRLLDGWFGTGLAGVFTPFQGQVEGQLAAGLSNSMGINTAIMLFLISLSLVAHLGQRPVVSQVLGFLALALPMISLTGYAYGFSLFYGQMSLLTASLGIMLSLSALSLSAHRAVLRALLTPQIGGRIARVQVLLGYLAPLGAGFVLLRYARLGASDNFLALFVVVMAWFIIGLASASAVVQEQSDRHRRKAEQFRVASLTRFQLIFESVSDAIFVVNPETGTFIDVNKAACTMFGFTHDELIGCTAGTLSTGVAPYTQADAVTRMGTEQSAPFDWHCRAKDGHLFWAEISQRATMLEGRPVGLSILREITERKRQHEEVTYQAHFDTLTGLPNRLDFDATLEQEIARSGRYNRPLCMAIGDIDHFKLVNDTFGHPAGDVVLKTVAQLMRKSLRSADYISRWGGEEFTILLPETNSDAAEEMLNRLRVRIANHVIPEIGRAVTLSFGVTSYTKLDSPDDLLKRVDRALYTSKETGRNKVTKLRNPAELEPALVRDGAK